MNLYFPLCRQRMQGITLPLFGMSHLYTVGLDG
jgi:hypothetical protein